MFNFRKINLLKILKLEKIERQLIYVIILMIFLIANFLLVPISFRYDFSFGRAYTLSSSTKKILKSLDDIVNIKFFVSSDLPTRLLPLKTEVTDFLNEYKKESRGKIIVKILDPKKDQQAQNQARELGVPELQFSQLEQDKYAVTASYFGIAISYGDKREVVPQVTDLGSLEYNLTAAIYKLIKKDLAKIAIIGKKEIFDVREDDLATLKKVLQQQFEISFLDIANNSAITEIDSSYKSILVFANGEKVYENIELERIKNYLQKKGTAIFFVDGVWVLDSLQATEAKHNLFNLLKDWGVELNKDLILSTSAEMVNFGNELVQFFSPYPFWIRTNSFNSKISFFANINQLTFPWVSSLDLKKKENLEITELVKSTKKSWKQENNFILNPQAIPQPEVKNFKEFVIAAGVKKKNEGQIIVIPSSRFIEERYLTRVSDNLEFILNILNELASEGALSGIRQRAVTFYPLPDLPEQQKDLFKYANIFLLPVLFAVFGGLKLLKRR